ncbi:phosphoribosyltransferase [Rugamonas sp. DEMB1]|jgi:hypothetical protein|uniref:phosphoribosyltransferase n=1 Tax=Rugamonas sp. DEMB1 TaxID=3039386 RepID=UPI00244B68EE|nr:phosphoribosyltransferase [Rugamonas sp. DEMB1]WGG53593.1 phosphoribosyltransferase [Rugamonas sp. DEMB1]
MVLPLRCSWNHFPEVFIHAPESVVKRHVAYLPAKAGDVDAASELVLKTMSDAIVLAMLEAQAGGAPTLVAVHAEESVGVNAIPMAMADFFSRVIGWRQEHRIVQANVVNHTGADGFSRMARQAVFKGPVVVGKKYIIVDDFVGQGGTIANLRGHIHAHGGFVVGATALTGKTYSARLVPTVEQLIALRCKHGQIEHWWQQRLGFGFDCLTASEARYLIQTPTAERIMERIEAHLGRH